MQVNLSTPLTNRKAATGHQSFQYWVPYQQLRSNTQSEVGGGQQEQMLPCLTRLWGSKFWWSLGLRCGLGWHLILVWPVVEPHWVYALTYGGNRLPWWKGETAGNDQAVGRQLSRQFWLKIQHLLTIRKKLLSLLLSPSVFKFYLQYKYGLIVALAMAGHLNWWPWWEFKYWSTYELTSPRKETLHYQN